MKYFIDNWDKISTIFFAFLSAFFAGLSAYILWMEYKRNNPKIIVKMTKTKTLEDVDYFETINCSIINKGRRSIKITRCFFLLKDGSKFPFLSICPMSTIGTSPNFPQILNETEKFEFNFSFESLQRITKELTSKIAYLCFTDSTDIIYKYKIKKKYWKD